MVDEKQIKESILYFESMKDELLKHGKHFNYLNGVIDGLRAAIGEVPLPVEKSKNNGDCHEM